MVNQALSFFVLLLILTACQLTTPTSTPSSPGTTSPLPQDTAVPALAQSSSLRSQPTNQPPFGRNQPPSGGAALLGLVGQPDSLNPLTDNHPLVAELSPLLFETLLRVDPQSGRLQPGLAESWEYVADGRQVVFHLPPNLTWSDGSPLTPAAVVDSLRASRHPALDAFSQLEAPDDQSLKLTFAEIDCAAVTNLALLPLLPSSEITATMPAGSGPFIVAEWPADRRRLSLVRNPYYHGPGPAVENVTIRFLRADEVALALSEGQFDLLGPLPAEVVGFARPDFQEITYPAAQMIYLAINFVPKNGEALPPELRHALLLALDREAILQEALAGDGQLLAGSLLPGHWAANGALSIPDYDPAAARSILSRAGWRDRNGDGWLEPGDERLELGIRLNGQNELYQRLGWLLSSYYRDVGLLARAESVPVDSVIDDLFTHDFDLAIFSWPILPDPDQRLYWHSTQNSEGMGLNFTSYQNPEVDRLFDEAVAIPGCNEAERAEVYGDIQRILAEERPVDFLLAPNRHLLVADRLQGVQPGPFAPFTWNVTDWSIVQ